MALNNFNFEDIPSFRNISGLNLNFGPFSGIGPQGFGNDYGFPSAFGGGGGGSRPIPGGAPFQTWQQNAARSPSQLAGTPWQTWQENAAGSGQTWQQNATAGAPSSGGGNKMKKVFLG